MPRGAQRGGYPQGGSSSQASSSTYEAYRTYGYDAYSSYPVSSYGSNYNQDIQHDYTINDAYASSSYGPYNSYNYQSEHNTYYPPPPGPHGHGHGGGRRVRAYEDRSYQRRNYHSPTNSPPSQRRASPSYSPMRDSSPAPFMMKPAFGRSSPPRDSATSPPHTFSPPPIPLSSGPSEEYLSASLGPSTRIPDPSTSRKLLILDLNGTLLFRSQNRRAPDASQPHQYNSTHLGPRLRSVHPRPYAPSFVLYLFAPETRAWLDTMVWSSAQPHSVDDMVDKVFGEAKAKLRAIWDRQSLGLARNEYHRKTQTTKDLAKPWMLLSSHSSNPSSPETYTKALDRHHASAKSPPPLDPDTDTPPGLIHTSPDTPPSTSVSAADAHSAHTTLLLDDSPLKARLQPYNHVCLPEYTGALRAKDVRALELMEHELGRDLERGEDQVQGDGAEANAEADSSSSPESKKRKRAPRDVSGSHSPSPSIAPALANRETPSDDAQETQKSQEAEEEPFDPTLLAVIGVLDVLKHESNAAAWVRARGLFATVTAEVSSSPSPTAVDVEDTIKADGDEAEWTGVSTANEQPSAVTEAAAVPSAPNAAVPELNRRLLKKHRKREEKAAERTAESEASCDVKGEGQKDGVGEGAGEKMWFSDAHNFAYWVGRGRDALKELGIEEVHGVRSAN